MFFTSVRCALFIDDKAGSLTVLSSEIKIVIFISFVLDMILAMNTGYYNK